MFGDRKGQYSIRVNSQWRICFVWTDEDNAAQVEIIDYHLKTLWITIASQIFILARFCDWNF